MPESQAYRQGRAALRRGRALSSQLQSRALDYIRAHPFSPLDVAFHNTLRMFELEGSFAWHASYDAIGLPARAARGSAWSSFWVLLALAIAGAVHGGPARGAAVAVGLPGALLALVAFVNVETPRFREPIDPFLILLAACAVATAAPRGLRTERCASRASSGTSELAGDHAELVKMVERLA